MGKKQTLQIPNILLSVKDASVAISVSSKMMRLLIASGRLKAVNLGKRMTRISLQELTDFAEGQGCDVVLPSSSLPFNNDRRERNKKVSEKPEAESRLERDEARWLVVIAECHSLIVGKAVKVWFHRALQSNHLALSLAVDVVAAYLSAGGLGGFTLAVLGLNLCHTENLQTNETKNTATTDGL